MEESKSFEILLRTNFFSLSRIAFTNTDTRKVATRWRVEEDAIRGKEHEERGRGIVMYRDRSHDRPGQGRAPRQVPKQVYTRVPTRPLFSPSLFFPPSASSVWVLFVESVGGGGGRKLVR